jgi:hypothetical protein
MHMGRGAATDAVAALALRQTLQKEHLLYYPAQLSGTRTREIISRERQVYLYSFCKIELQYPS